MSLTGIDVSKWQAGLNPAAIGCNFVIAKATEGVGYVDDHCDTFVHQALSAGKLVGVYHFARNDLGNGPVEEADFFVSQVRGYIGKAVLALDWETTTSDVSWAKAFLDRVYTTTKVRPMIYMSASPAGTYNWSAVSKDYGLWIAGYPNSRPSGLATPDCPYVPGHGWKIAMWQYTSSGRTPGYAGNLDMNVFYGDRAAWGKYAGASGAQSAPSQFKDITALQRAVRATPDNVAGPDTRKRVDAVRKASNWGGVAFPYGVAYTQQVVNTTPDGVWGGDSRACHDRTVWAIQKAVGVFPDKIWGPVTDRAVNDALSRAEQP